MKRQGVYLLPPPLDGMLVHRRVTPSIKFAGTHLYTLGERGTVRVKCLAQEHNTMSPARARTQNARSDRLVTGLMEFHCKALVKRRVIVTDS